MIEVRKTVPADACPSSTPGEGSVVLVSARGGWKAKHGVEVFFPRSGRRGLNQEIVLKGGVRGVGIVEREIDRVLISWREDFEAFQDRRRRRRRERDHVRSSPPSTMAGVPSKSVKSAKSANRFAGLEEETMTAPDPIEASVPEVVKPKKPTLSGWAAIAAKPAATKVSVPATTVSSASATTESSDEEDDEEDDDDDAWDDFENNRAAGDMSWGDYAVSGRW